MPNRFKVLFGALLITLCACTPTQLAWYTHMRNAGGEYAAAIEATAVRYAVEREAATAGRPCAEWYDYAIEVGFTPEQWKEPISRIMFRESRCNPTAVSPSHDYCLMQINRSAHQAWLLSEGIIQNGMTDLFDPVRCMRAAHRVYERAHGWHPWVTY